MTDISHNKGDHTKGHEYHLVDPSPWPAVGALAGGVLLGGAVLYFHTSRICADQSVHETPKLIILL